MNENEARAILTQQLARYRSRSYSELAQIVGSNAVAEIRGESGAEYQMEIHVTWDSPREKVNVCVMGSIDDGRLLSAFMPICDSFVMSPDGKFVGE